MSITTARQSELPADVQDRLDREMAAFNRVNDQLRDDYGFNVFQIHAVHEAIRDAGMDLKLRQG